MAKVKIMAVDDEPDIISLQGKILKKAGYEFVGCLSGEEFLQKYPKEKPDLVLLDIMMPGMDGWDVYKAIRKINRNQKVAPVTALDVPPRIKEGIIQLGASDFITKPFDPGELVEKVKKILGEIG
jgi:two-component system response regulator MtrA